MTHRIARPKQILAALIAAVVAVTAAACGEFTGLPASLQTVHDSGPVYAINGAPLGAPTALHAFAATLVPANADFLFDVAFDLDTTTGAITFLPQRAVASGLATTHTVALATVADSFEAVGSAPNIAYRADTALVVKRLQVVIAQITDPTACGFSVTGTTIYAKMVIRSVNRLTRQMQLEYTVDPNCGFRSFAAGIPKA
jgi:hypothetical protein